MIKHFYEDILRKISSVLYRLLLISYSIFIIVYFDNIFPDHYYFFGISLYFASAAFLFVKGKLATLRLVLDLSLIFFVLYGKPLDNIATISFIYLPIVNSPNHTGSKKSFFTLHLLTLLLLVGLADDNERMLGVFPIFCFGVIGFFENVRNRFLKFAEKLYSVVDESYSENLEINKTHRVYRNLIDTIKKYKYFDYFPVENIYCLRIWDKKYTIVNTSKYVFHVKMTDKVQEDIRNLKPGHFLRDLDFTIDDEKIENNCLIKLKYADVDYVFIFELAKKESVYAVFCSLLVIYDVARLVFVKITRILDIERKIKATDLEHKGILKKNLDYIERSRLAMHFLRNKFSPIKTYLQLHEKIESAPSSDIKEKLQQIRDGSRPKAIQSMETILTHTDRILEEYTTFSFHKLEEHTIGKLFSITRRIWEDQVESGSINIGWDKDNFKEVVYLNETGIHMVISDIVDNIRKYSEARAILSFKQDAEKYSIVFENSFMPTKKDDLIKLAAEFMASEADEIFMRKTHGLSMVKRILSQMRINSDVHVEEDLFVFELTFERRS